MAFSPFIPEVEDRFIALETKATATAALVGTVKPNFVAIAGSIYTTTNNASQDIPYPGVLATDIVVATLQTAGATPRTITTVKTKTDAVTITFSGAPSTDHIVNVMVFRAC